MRPDGVVNTNCSFNPGENTIQIQGDVRPDLHNNRCDNNDFPSFPIKFSLSKLNSGKVFS